MKKPMIKAIIDPISPPLDSQLAHFRTKINTLDESIIQLLAQRQRIIEQVAIYKHENNLPPVIPHRVKAVIEQAKDFALEYQVNSDMVEKLYQTIIYYACELEEKLIEQQSK